jgi:hypothetical protein
VPVSVPDPQRNATADPTVAAAPPAPTAEIRLPAVPAAAGAYLYGANSWENVAPALLDANNPTITRQQLADAGLKAENIETAGRCTVCETRHFFSYRGEGSTGRMAAVIALRNGSGK